MTVRLSTGLRNNIVGPTGIGASFANGIIEIRTGSQPATADSAATGTLLGTVTLASGVFTPETAATQTITISGTTGSINTVNVGTTGPVNIIPLGPVSYTTSPTATAEALRDAIIRNGIYRATSSGAVVTVIAPPGTGSAHNGLALTTTTTDLTATSGGNMTGGVDAVNGLMFTAPSSGSISKSGVWSFNGVATGTAGWFRMKASALDANGVSTTLCRLDGSVATSGGDMSLANLSITSGTPTTIDVLSISIPAQ
ncbi:MAG: hypothetical protein IPH35_19720 [Rhodoferax sp.]|nr:hypothetical protein [Rhodoferax sp.]